MRGMILAAALGATAAMAQENQQLLPLTESGAVPKTMARIQSGATSGEEAAASGLTLSGLVELTVLDRASVRFTFDYNGDQGVSPAARVKVQLLRQEEQGVDASVGARYKTVGLDPSASEVEGFFAASRRFGQAFLAANLVGGGSVKTGDRDVELRAGGGYLVNDHVAVGADARFVREWNPADGEVASTGRPFDLVAGPTASLTYGYLQLSAIAGVHLPQDTAMVTPYVGAGAGVAF